MNSKNTIIIGVLAESPYSESAGDVGIPYCTGSTITGGDGCRYDGSNPYLPEKQRKTLELNYDAFDHKVLDHVWEHDKNIPLVTVMLAGRPMLINNSVNISSAVIAGWLPGTSGGQGIVDAISGDYRLKSKGDRTNTLSFDWPTN
jgi:beta-glucosidase